MHATHIKEAPFKTADLTGRTLQFGKVRGPFAKKAYIAYVKLVPLTDQEVADLQADRARKETRVLQANIDGLSYFWSNEYQTREQIKELIEPYRDSDVGKVVWAVSYGDLTNYPTKVGTWWAREREVPINISEQQLPRRREGGVRQSESAGQRRHHSPRGCLRSTRTRWD